MAASDTCICGHSGSSHTGNTGCLIDDNGQGCPCVRFKGAPDVARLTALLAERDAEIKGLREALLSDCPTVEGDRDHPCWCDAGVLNHLQDCWQRRAALAARGWEAS